MNIMVCSIGLQKCGKKYFQNGGIELRYLAFVSITKPIWSLHLRLRIHYKIFGLISVMKKIPVLYIPIVAYLLSYKKVVYLQTVKHYIFLRHCFEMNNWFLPMDAPRQLHDQLNYWFAVRDRNLIPSYGSIYYPWLWNGDELFPSGALIAGMYVRVEKSHPPLGIQWPPANVILYGVTHLDVELHWEESQEYIEHSINKLFSKNLVALLYRCTNLVSWSRLSFHKSSTILNLVIEQVRRYGMGRVRSK